MAKKAKPTGDAVLTQAPIDQPAQDEVHVPALRLGHLQRIKNLHRTFGSDTHYIRVRLQEEDGSEFTALLTEADLRETRARADRNPEDVTAAPLLVDLTD